MQLHFTKDFSIKPMCRLQKNRHQPIWSVPTFPLQCRFYCVFRILPYKHSALEEDFFVRSKSELLPVEVKSNNARSKSLSSLIKNENYSDIKNGIKFGDFNVGYVNNIYTFPYFCAFMIKAFVKKLD